MKDIKDMSDQELFDEFVAYDQLINDVGCYGVKDMMYYSAIQEEMFKRNMKIQHKWELRE